MTLLHLPTPTDLTTHLTTHPHSLICFSATWCGPCKASKPALESLAAEFHNDPTLDLQCGICYEHEIGEDIQSLYRIRAFPTYVLFKKTSGGGSGFEEVERVQGVNFEGIKQMVAKAGCKKVDMGVGHSLGGGGAALSAEEARMQRLARFGGGATEADSKPPAAASPAVKDEEMKDASAESAGTAESAAATPPNNTDNTDKTDDSAMEIDKKEDAKMDEPEMVDPTATLSQEDLDTLTNAMGFSLIRAQKGLLFGTTKTVESAVEWLMEHQEDEGIDDPIPLVPKDTATNAATATGGLVAQSYKCNECGKILSNMANLELHANKTGHSDFEESTQSKKPLTEDEKKAKIAEIKSLLKAKRMEREATEKNENIDREKQRRFMGKEMAKTREQMEVEARKRQALMKKKEKEAALRERQRIRAELEKDRRERAANKGKLGSRLGVDGYNPDGIQYDVPVDGEGGAGAGSGGGSSEDATKKKKAAPSAAKMDEYISKISSYRAGGDGGNCLKILKLYIGNIVNHPEDAKYRKINMENKAYKTKVKPFLGAKNLLLGVGFHVSEDGSSLELEEGEVDMEVLRSAKEKLEVAYEKYMK